MGGKNISVKKIFGDKRPTSFDPWWNSTQHMSRASTSARLIKPDSKKYTYGNEMYLNSTNIWMKDYYPSSYGTRLKSFIHFIHSLYFTFTLLAPSALEGLRCQVNERWHYNSRCQWEGTLYTVAFGPYWFRVKGISWYILSVSIYYKI